MAKGKRDTASDDDVEVRKDTAHGEDATRTEDVSSGDVSSDGSARLLSLQRLPEGIVRATTVLPLVTAAFYVYIRYVIARFYRPLGVAPEDLGFSEPRLIATAAALTAATVLTIGLLVWIVSTSLRFWSDFDALDAVFNGWTLLLFVVILVLAATANVTWPVETGHFFDFFGSLLTLGTSWGSIVWMLALFAFFLGLFMRALLLAMRSDRLARFRPLGPYLSRTLIAVAALVALGPVFQLPREAERLGQAAMGVPGVGLLNVGSTLSYYITDTSSVNVTLHPIGEDVAKLCQLRRGRSPVILSVLGSHDGTTFLFVKAPHQSARVVSFPTDSYTVRRAPEDATPSLRPCF